MERALPTLQCLVSVAGGLALIGCSASPAGRGLEGSLGAGAGTTDLSSSFLGSPANALEVVHLIFEVARVDLPMDELRHSRKIWNHVDELRIDPDVVARLRRNGLRVGAATQEDWPPIRAILEAGGAEARQESLVAQPGLPLLIELAVIGESESIFSYEKTGRLVGNTFPQGQKVLNIDYVLHAGIGAAVDLKLSYEVRHDRGVMTWERQDGIIRQVPAYDRHVFSDVTVALTLNPTEFVVIGLSDQAENEYLVGSRFLVSVRGGKRYESLLFVTPKPVRSRRPTTAGS